jgi:hypothetical protein
VTSRTTSAHIALLAWKITISGLKTTIIEQETAAPQGLFSKFPQQAIKEFFLKNGEF